MEQIAPSEADSHSASEEIPSLIQNPKIHNRVHKIPAVTFRNKLSLSR